MKCGKYLCQNLAVYEELIDFKGENLTPREDLEHFGYYNQPVVEIDESGEELCLDPWQIMVSYSCAEHVCKVFDSVKFSLC